MSLTAEASLLIPTLLLIVASVLDLRYGKFPNWLFIASLVIGLVWIGFNAEPLMLLKSLGYAALTFAILAPLVFLRVLGAGDIKLFSVFCLLTNPTTLYSVFLFSLVWGLVFGLSKLLVAGELRPFLHSLVLKTPQTRSHKIPYTIAILLGWMSFLTVGGWS